MPVRMAEHWFEIASVDHFWVRRRFAVLQKLAAQRILAAQAMAEVGCGHGLLQKQIEDAYGKEVSGFDLNESALRQNVSRRSKLYCYDIFQSDAALRERFDLIVLFDVLEHISEESSFLRSLLFHLSPSGSLLVNVPAGQWAFSSYDDAAGHVRRYSIKTLRQVMTSNGLALKEWTYWGLPLVPSLVLRKLWLMRKHGENEIIRAGFDSRSSVVNWMMALLSGLEWIPQRFLGTSLMAVFRRTNEAEANPAFFGKGPRD
ncbi:MAG TPA: class I SAM-dependent methyltransferase [Candidatus Bathyarchaeia archaeon]|nr:class I SAM-dependent methyltransferase [Candidatus Bathyarchaeia archaeon]